MLKGDCATVEVSSEGCKAQTQVSLASRATVLPKCIVIGQDSARINRMAERKTRSANQSAMYDLKKPNRENVSDG
jgi:hypothetical protein